MLTEIAWWGGLIFIWWALCYWMLIKEWDTPVDLSYISMHAAFISTAAVLALYFYPLEAMVMKYVYLASLGISIVAILLLFFLPESEAVKQAEADKAEEAKDEEGEEEEAEAGLELLGQIILFAPLFITVLLGLYKSYGIAQQLGWLA